MDEAVGSFSKCQRVGPTSVSCGGHCQSVLGKGKRERKEEKKKAGEREKRRTDPKSARLKEVVDRLRSPHAVHQLSSLP